MNKNAIQRYAVWARKELIAQVSQRAYQFGIDADSYGDYDALTVAGRTLSSDERKQRQQLINLIRSKGYTQVMEEVAYTWFNRFIALRFMEVNNYLPTHIRVFSDASGAFRPEILSNALHLDLPGLDMEKVSDLIEENQTEDLYRYLLLTQCNAFYSVMPRMFERMGSYTELLLPNNILRPDGVLGRLVTDIPEEDWTDQVQIIGWLYQYYNSELKDDTFAKLKNNVKVTKERIPAATQLFTPDWIVRYMVENSLGRLWLEGHPNDELKAGWKYYLDEAEQEPEVQKQLDAIRAEYRNLQPQDIRVIDPCMGSGHILVYAFDVLMQIYRQSGFSDRDAVKSIIENNLYGLDIDDRAAQLAYFAVMMKARQYDRRFLTRLDETGRPDVPQPEVYSTTSVPGGDEYGSLLTFDDPGPRPELAAQTGLFEESEAAWHVKHLLSQKYHVVVTNPPYMGSGGMNSQLSEYVKYHFPDAKADLFSTFMEKAYQFAKERGFTSLITMESWMFLSSFEKLRAKVINNKTIISMVHMPYLGKGGTSLGINFGTAAVIMRNFFIPEYAAQYEYTVYTETDENGVPFVFPTINERWKAAKQSDFSKIPGSPMAYWVSEAVLNTFNNGKISRFAEARIGMATGQNDRYLRLWYEVSIMNVGFHQSREGAILSGLKWFPYEKGGAFRKWYGNRDYIVDWQNDGFELQNTLHPDGHRIWAHNFNLDYIFQKNISWTDLTTGSLSFRAFENGFLFDSSSTSAFITQNYYHILAYLNTKLVNQISKILNPTMHFTPGDFASLPYITVKDPRIDSLAINNIDLSRADWDSFETSWDFLRHPLIRGVTTVHEAYEAWTAECEERFQTLKANEEELNRIFIEIYGLQDELAPEEEDKDVTVRRADLGRDIRSLISYAVGCMFGRYSLDEKGLILAGQSFSDRFAYASVNLCGTSVTGASSLDSVQGDCYLLVPGEPIRHCTYAPDPDNVLPICDDEYFEDDIVGKFVAFVRTVYGENTLEENLKFIADALGGKGTPREVIRNYFLNGFYADHLKTYQKRPIYWLFDSGKKNGFKALIYMHRYQSDLLARLRTDYVHEQQERYRTQLKHIGDAMDSASAPERVKLAKQQKKLQEQALELQKYEEKVHHLADQYIKIDLDDGVKHNYALFADVLAKIG